jgi:hypothetical protein
MTDIKLMMRKDLIYSISLQKPINPLADHRKEVVWDYLLQSR